MLTHPTHEHLVALGLTGMAKALEEQRRSPDLDALSFEERLGLLVDREAAERDSKRLTARLRRCARMPASRTSTGARRAAWTGRCLPGWWPGTG